MYPIPSAGSSSSSSTCLHENSHKHLVFSSQGEVCALYPMASFHIPRNVPKKMLGCGSTPCTPNEPSLPKWFIHTRVTTTIQSATNTFWPTAILGRFRFVTGPSNHPIISNHHIHDLVKLCSYGDMRILPPPWTNWTPRTAQGPQPAAPAPPWEVLSIDSFTQWIAWKFYRKKT